MAEIKVGYNLHKSYIDEKEPKLAEYKKTLAKLKAKANPSAADLSKIKSYERVIDSITANLYLIKEIYKSGRPYGI